MDIHEPLPLGSPEFAADPYPFYARLRTEGIAHRSERWNCWYVTRFRPCRDVLWDKATFDPIGQHLLPALQSAVDSGEAVPEWTFQPTPPGQRVPERRVLGRALTAPDVDELCAGFTARCFGRAKKLAQSGDGHVVDLVAGYAGILVPDFLADMFGIAPEDRPTFHAWVTGAPAFLSDSERPAEVDPKVMWKTFARSILANRSRAGNFVGVLVAQLERECEGLSREDRLSQLVAKCLMIARVTAQGLTLGFSTIMWTLLGDPDQYARLRTWPGQCARAVDEGLRYESPTQALGRITRHETDLGSHRVAPGELVILLVGSAHRDPGYWYSPDTFDPAGQAQDITPGLAFSHGEASCVGAALSRRLLTGMLSGIVEYFPVIESARGERWFTGFANRGLTRLPVYPSGHTGARRNPDRQ